MPTLDRLRVGVARDDRAVAATINQKNKLKLFTPLLALTVAGCTSVPLPDTSTSHPANSQAVQGTLPPLVPVLMNLTNMVMVMPITAPTPEHQHGHEAPETKPNTEEKK